MSTSFTRSLIQNSHMQSLRFYSSLVWTLRTKKGISKRTILICFIVCTSLINAKGQIQRPSPDSVKINEIGISCVTPLGFFVENQYHGDTYFGHTFVSASYRYGSPYFKNRITISYQEFYYESLMMPAPKTLILDSLELENGEILRTTDTSEVRLSRSGNSQNLTLRFNIEWLLYENSYTELYYGLEGAAGATYIWRKSSTILRKEDKISGDVTRTNFGINNPDAIMFNTNLGAFAGATVKLSKHFRLDFKAGLEYIFFYGSQVSEYDQNHELERTNIDNHFNTFNISTDISLYYGF